MTTYCEQETEASEKWETKSVVEAVADHWEEVAHSLTSRIARLQDRVAHYRSLGLW